MNILFCAAEVVPFAKTGGLADVAGALPLALGKRGHRVLIATPQFAGQAGQRLVRLSPNVQVIFIEHPSFYHRDGIYGNAQGDHPDNAARFSFLCHEALKESRRIGFKPDIVHAHDWHTGPLPMILKTLYKGDPFFKKTKSLFTIHNLAYQGLFPAEQFFEMGVGPSPWAFKKCEFWGKVSYIKAGLEFADAINAVSPTYAAEILTREHGCGLDAMLRRRRGVVSGILNGIDTDVWDPARDKGLRVNFSAGTLSRREANRQAMLKRFGLWAGREGAGAKAGAGADSAPVFGMVSRLAEQKGFDIVLEAFEGLMKRGIKFVLLGTGEKKYEEFFKKAQKRYSGQAACVLGFSGAEASMIYGGADFFLMPSRFEPCGLGQLIAFRYGAIPIVHRTGGLADTVTDATAKRGQGNGIVFNKYDAKSLLAAADRAVRLFADKKEVERVRLAGMKADFSWKLSAAKYEKLYRELANC